MEATDTERQTGGAVPCIAEPVTSLTREVPGLVCVVASYDDVLAGARQPRVRRGLQVGAAHRCHRHSYTQRYTGVGDGVQGGTCPRKFGKNFFSGIFMENSGILRAKIM